MLELSKIENALCSAKSWFIRHRRADQGWGDEASAPNDTGKALWALFMTGEALNSELIRGGITWFIENKSVWNPRIVRKDQPNLDWLIWALFGLILSKSKFTTKLLNEGIINLESRQLTENDSREVAGLWAERIGTELCGIYSTAFTIMLLHGTGNIHTQPHSDIVKKAVSAIKENKASDGGWGLAPSRLRTDVRSDPVFTAFVVESLLAAGLNLNDPCITAAKEFLCSPRARHKDGSWRSHWAGQWAKRKFGIEDDRSIEATSAAVTTLLLTGVDFNSEIILQGIKWIIDHQEPRGEDKGGWKLVPHTSVLNFSTYYGIRALRVFYDICVGYEKTRSFLNESNETNRSLAYTYFIALAEDMRSRTRLTVTELCRLGILTDETLSIRLDKTTSNRRLKELEMLDEKGPLTTRQLRDLFKIPKSVVNQDVTKLKELGLLSKAGQDKYWTRFDYR